MQLRGNDIIIYKGESFTMDFTLKNRDDSPYVLSKELRNPHIRIAIASDKQFNNKLIKEFWLPLTDYPARFYSTVPMEVASWPEILDGFDSTETMFCRVNENGVKEYKYWDGTKFVDYEFRVIYSFTPNDTLDLVEQNYFYNVILYSGELEEGDEVKFASIDTITSIIPTSKLSILSNLNGGV